MKAANANFLPAASLPFTAAERPSAQSYNSLISPICLSGSISSRHTKPLGFQMCQDAPGGSVLPSQESGWLWNIPRVFNYKMILINILTNICYYNCFVTITDNLVLRFQYLIDFTS